MLTFFNNEKFNIQVTLDGYEEVHNSLRFYKNNVGTFNDIINNLFIINNYTSIKVTVRVNITSSDFELYLRNDKNVLILDEPTNYVDEDNKQRIYDLIRQINKANKIIIIVSHDKAFNNICDKTILLNKLN